MDEHICENLHELNDSSVKGGSHALADAPMCDWPEIFPKILYSIWCLLKNIINTLCWLIGRIDELERRVNAICDTLKCVVEYLQRQNEAMIAEAFKNIHFKLTGTGTYIAADTTFTKIESSDDGNFSVNWNMVFDGVEEGVGKVKGKVNHSYSLNKDGSMQANIQSVTLYDATYTRTGTRVYPAANRASFTMYDRRGSVMFTKDYHPLEEGWTVPLNKTLEYNISKRIEPNGSMSELILKTLDDWDRSDTRGDLFATYTNDNKPVHEFECSAPDC